MASRKFGHLCKLIMVVGLLACGLTQTTHADGLLSNDKIQWDGFASYQFGQIVKGDYNGQQMTHWWNHQVLAGVGFVAKMNDRLTVRAKIDGQAWNVYPGNDGLDWHRAKMSLWLDQANGVYNIDDAKNPKFTVTAGYFIFKYNDEVRDLGEYLFRSFTYPGLMFNSPDFAAARLLGVDFSQKLCNGNFKNDFMITEESELWPFGDISISDVASYNFANVFKVGGGVDFARIIPSNKQYTTPSDTSTPAGSKNHIIDSINGNVPVYGSGFYTFQATKVMGHFSFDPKPLFGNPTIFGSEDCKLYGEIAVIGLKNYSLFYDKLSERMPMMLGFNIPTFKMMDCLSIECEYYSSPYVPYIMPVEQSYIPLPILPDQAGTYNFSTSKVFPWKWSVYAKKNLLPGLYATLQLSRDHYWPNYTDGYPSYNEALTQNGQWMWFFKLSASL